MSYIKAGSLVRCVANGLGVVVRGGTFTVCVCWENGCTLWASVEYLEKIS